MTDREIMRALEHCFKEESCQGCPYSGYLTECSKNSPKDALDLINRKQAEIERLKEELEEAETKYEKVYEQVAKDIKANLAEKKKMTISEIEKKLGYGIEIVKNLVGE